MRLYNTLTRTINDIKPLNPPTVTVYTCGPTVYDYAHIGHWFNYIRMDILVRTLRASGLQPQWVMNITDVGHLVSDADDGIDKLEKGAAREGKTAWEVARYYTDDFLACMGILGIEQPNHITKATEHIPEQIQLIQTLEAKGFTYQTSDGIYYDTSKFPSYAAFAKLDLDGLQDGARIGANPEKRNPSDFALWKFSPPATENNGEKRRDMEWESPWGIGFPGWHIECSAMSMKYLGDTLDIHTGGIDHIPVHHTNEIAQSEAATGRQFARHWMHGNHVMAEGEKISKSLGNGTRLQTIITEDNVQPEAIRLLVLESHYRSQSQYSLVGAVAAQARLQRLQAMAVLRWQTVDTTDTSLADSIAAVIPTLTHIMQNDLNTPAAVAYLSEVETMFNKQTLPAADVAAFTTMLEAIDALLGLKLAEQADITTEQKQLIADRTAARANKDWAESDTIRVALLAQHIAVRDTPTGPIWYRV